MKSVANGKVVYLGVMAGYGSVLIIDHGKRCYSLYGKLSSVASRMGDTVAAGQVIAKADDSSGSNFYFELRRNSQPTDPLAILMRR